MAAYIDLHCHWLPGVDDGAPSVEEGVAMLRGLGKLGFELVIATPHMRPGLFDNDRDALVRRFDEVAPQVANLSSCPRIELSSEHYFDDVVVGQLLADRGLPYPGGRAVLLEFYDMDFPVAIDHKLAELRRHGLLPVIAHPERYQVVGRQPEVLERLLDVGAAALLDIAALTGKYGRRPRRTAEELLEAGLYHAACSDAHRVQDLDEVKRAMELLAKRYGDDEIELLLDDGPRQLLKGRIPS
jgi:protein-tyrosine phosphatase